MSMEYSMQLDVPTLCPFCTASTSLDGVPVMTKTSVRRCCSTPPLIFTKMFFPFLSWYFPIPLAFNGFSSLMTNWSYAFEYLMVSRFISVSSQPVCWWMMLSRVLTSFVPFPLTKPASLSMYNGDSSLLDVPAHTTPTIISLAPVYASGSSILFSIDSPVSPPKPPAVKS